MTVIVVLAGLLISHFLAAVAQLRRFDWLLWPLLQLRQKYPDFDWLPLAMVLILGLLAPALIVWLVSALLGAVGWLLLALLVFVFVLGPRDLDRDVRVLLERSEGEGDEVAESAAALHLSLGSSAPEAAAAVFHGALSRWFGVVFWFVVLGIPGALLYRLNRVVLHVQDLRQAELEWLGRLRLVLDWPVLALMTLAAALCGDLDRVYHGWRSGEKDQPLWLFTPAVIDRVAANIADEDDDMDEGLRAGHRMAWRMLVLWLVFMSVLLLAGWLV